MILFSDTAQELCDVWHDAATEAQDGSLFLFVGAADIAVAKWSSATVSARIYRVLSAMDDAAARYGALQRCTTACLCVNFNAILWQLAMQSCDAAQ